MANAERSVAEIEKELEEARIRERDNRAAGAEYPKMVELPGDPENRLVVNSPEEEAKQRGEVVKAFDLTPSEQEAKTFAKAEADKEAAGAQSRLAGPEAVTTKGKNAHTSLTAADKAATKPPANETKAEKSTRVKSEKAAKAEAKKAAATAKKDAAKAKKASKPGVLSRAVAKVRGRK